MHNTRGAAHRLTAACKGAVIVALLLSVAWAGTALADSREKTRVPGAVFSGIGQTTLGGARSASVAEQRPQYGGTINIINSANITIFGAAVSNRPTGQDGYVLEQLLGIDRIKGPAGSGQADYGDGPQTMADVAGKLAASWSTPSVGVWVLDIRQGVHFALDPNSEASRLVNGREMTADDVKFSLEYLRDTPSSWIRVAEPAFSGNMTVEKTGPWQVTVRTPVNPQSGYLWLMGGAGSQYVWPKEMLELYGTSNAWRDQVGTGPFILTDWVPNSLATYARNGNYWDKNPVGPGAGDQLPYADGVNVFIISDVSTQLAAMRTGKADTIATPGFVSRENWANLQNTNPQLKSYAFLRLPLQIGFRRDKPELPFKDIRVRQALMMATDMTSIKNGLFGGQAEILDSPARKLYPSIYTPLEQLPADIQALYGYHPDQAKFLLTDAGYPNGFKTALTIDSSSAASDMAQTIKAMWAKVGVDVEIQVKENAAFMQLWTARSYDQMMMTANAGGNGALFSRYSFSYFRGTNSYNISYVNDPPGSDPVIEKAFQDVSQAIMVNYPECDGILKALGPYILRQAFLAPTPAPYAYRVWQPWLKNYYGEASAKYWLQYAWVDQDLKRLMLTSWSVPMTVTTATQGSNNSLAFGVKPGASDGYDSGVDVPHPPPAPGATCDSYFPVVNPISDSVDRDYRGAAASVQWTLCVKSSVEGATVGWDVGGLPPSGLSLTLTGSGLNVNMKSQSSVKLMPSGQTQSLTITALINSPPVLSNGAVTPTSGAVTTAFTYSANFTDVDNTAPASITVSIDGGPPQAMSLKPGGDGDFSNGEIYQYTRIGLVKSVPHSFQFAASDGSDNATGDTGPHAGPTVANSPPTAPAVDVTPNSPVTTDDLLCTIVTPSSDPDGDNVTYAYAWYKDNVLEAGLTGTTVASGNTTRGQVWKCVVTPNDGTVDGLSGQDQVTIGNTPPTAPVVDVRPNSPLTTDDLLCTIVTPSTDADGDNVTSAYAWYKNNVLQAGLTSNNVSAPNTAKGEVWKCAVTPNDGTVNGPSGQDQVTIGNTPPVLSLGTVAPASGNVTTSFIYSANYTDVDNDGPSSVTVSIDGGPPHTMALKPGGDGSFVNGEIYEYTASGLVKNMGHIFAFAASDGSDNATGDIAQHAGPSVANSPPVANAGPDQKTVIGRLVTLDGRSSSDADSDNLTYMWAQTGGSTSANLSSATSPAPTFSPAVSDNYTFSLVVNDGTDNSTADSVIVVVRQSNAPPVLSSGAVNPASGQTTTTFDYTVTYSDNDDDPPAFVNVSIDGGAVQAMSAVSGNITGGMTYRYSTGLAAGSHTYQFSASDGIDPATGDTASHSGPTVTSPPSPPAGGGGFGGGGGGAALPGYTSLSPYINDEGRFNLDATITCASGDAWVNIAKGVVAKDQTGGVLKQMAVLHVDTLPAPPSDSKLIAAHDVMPDGAAFTPTISLVIKFDAKALPVDVKTSGLYIARWDGTKWVALETSLSESAGTATSAINGYGRYALAGKVTPPVTTSAPPAASFSVSGVSVSPAAANAGQTVTVSARVSNAGGTSGDYEVVLKINGTLEASKRVSLAAGGSETVTFAVTRNASGTYQVDVNGTTGSFTIQQVVPMTTTAPPQTQAPAPPKAKQTNAWLIVGIVVAVLVVAGVIFGVTRMRKKPAGNQPGQQ